MTPEEDKPKQLSLNEQIIDGQAKKIFKLKEELEIKNIALFNIHRERRYQDTRDKILTWEQLAYYLLDKLNEVISHYNHVVNMLDKQSLYGQRVNYVMKKFIEQIDTAIVPKSFEDEHDKSIDYLVDEGVFREGIEGIELNPEAEDEPDT